MLKNFKGFILLLVCMIPAVYSSNVISETIKIATSPKNTAYYEFMQSVIQRLKDTPLNDLEIDNIDTEGSIENLNLLKEGKVDFAIVQDDIAHYVFYGKNGLTRFNSFEAALPLFDEYVQILVSSKNNIKILKDLAGRSINVGADGSGTFHNAMDVLRAAGLRRDVDYLGFSLSGREAVKRLVAGKLDVVFHTSSSLPRKDEKFINSVKLVPVPVSIIEDLIAKKPYYSKSYMPAKKTGMDTDIPTLAVRAYLVVGNHVPAENIQQFMNAVIKIWAKLNEQYGMAPLEQSLKHEPIPYSRIARTVLIDNEIIEADYSQYVIFGLVILILALVWWSHKTVNSYDRMGGTTGRGSYIYMIANIISKSSSFINIVIIFLILISVIVIFIQYFELDYARKMNVANEFANLSFADSMLWMLTFMGAGFPGDYYPASQMGKVMAAIVPFLGVSTLIGLIFVVNERVKASALNRKKGLAIKPLNNHVLICGWNEKVPGIVYTLTAKGAVERKHVVIIAEMEGEVPLEKYNFNSEYVYYCRGDSADHLVLEKASAKYAEAAVIVAGQRKRSTRNIRSILSAMAIREAGRNPAKNGYLGVETETFIVAEMVYSENRFLFESSGVNSIIWADEVANRIAAYACVEPRVVDFILDMLTVDSHMEMYAVPVSKIKNIVGLTSEKISRIMLKAGVNLLGVRMGGERKDVVFEEGFRSNGNMNLLFSRDEKGYKVKYKDRLICIADDLSDIIKLSRSSIKDMEDDVDSNAVDKESVFDFSPQFKNIIITGPLERCEVVADQLKNIAKVDANIQIFTEGGCNNEAVVTGRFADRNDWIRAGIYDADIILILGSTDKSIEISLHEDRGDIDAMAILSTRMIRDVTKDKNSPTIVAEIANIETKKLFIDAGVDVVVPVNLIVERMLAKMVYNRGHVCDFIMALLNTSGDRYLLPKIVSEKDDICGLTVDSIFKNSDTDAKLLAFLPGAESRQLKNEMYDFDYHVIGTPCELTKNRTIKKGDILFFLIESSQGNCKH